MNRYVGIDATPGGVQVPENFHTRDAILTLDKINDDATFTALTATIQWYRDQLTA